MKNALLTVVGCGLLAVCCRPAEADLLTVDPTSQTANLGSPVNVGVSISGLGMFMAPSLGAYDINVNFDPTILQLLGVTFGDPIFGDQLDLTGLGSIQSEISGLGTVELFELSFDSIDELNANQAPEFELGTLAFRALGLGTSPITISINALSDAYGDVLVAGTQNGTVMVNPAPVPEASSIFLLGTVVGLITMRRRRV